MNEICEYTRSTNDSSGRRRVSEYAYSGNVDDNGCFKLTGYMGHIYPAEKVKAVNDGTREEIANMSIATQSKNMQAIHSLVSQDLSCIYGECESDPNGAKKMFHSKSAAFLRALSKDLGFNEMKVTNNHGGIAMSGEITLMGMWGDNNGLYLQIFQSATQKGEFLYRHIAHMKDYSGGPNQWLSDSLFEAGDYEKLVDILLALKKLSGVMHHAA